MPIYNFDKILQTNNLSYLVVGWNERNEITPPEAAVNRWNEIYNLYCERTANNDTLTFYSLSCEIGYLEMRYTVITHLVYGLSEYNKEDYGRELNAWGIPFNIKGSILDQVEQLQRHLRIAKQNLDLKTRKLKSLKGDDETKESTSFLKQIIIIQEQLGVKIDIRKDSVEFFLTAIERLKEKLEQQKKVRNG
uniref:hypothetical protein n=1 Tax=Seonamhaeicola sp. TaxID=1912245 RepID=UPI0035665F0E